MEGKIIARNICFSVHIGTCYCFKLDLKKCEHILINTLMLYTSDFSQPVTLDSGYFLTVPAQIWEVV